MIEALMLALWLASGEPGTVKAEDRGQKTEDRGPKTEDRAAEDRAAADRALLLDLDFLLLLELLEHWDLFTDD